MENFTGLGLSEPLVETITGLGFEKPTPIQTQAIPILLEEDKDLIGLAQTGTGKTAAFGLPLLDLVDTEKRQTQALILAPTRELCLQITKELLAFSTHLKKLRIQPVYGGADIYTQIRNLKKGAHIIVATPGRLRDLIRREEVDLSGIEFVILDEADEMLNMGFKEELDDILQYTPKDKSAWLFSATMSSDVKRISRQYMSNPVEVSVRKENLTNVDIDHQYVTVYPSGRFEALKRFLDYNPDTYGVVFCRTRKGSKNLADDLAKEGYRADALHGDLNQSQRDRVMERFRSKRLQVLIATDVAARGIDVQDLTHVFHFNIPEDLAFYTHRSGRTGRAGKKGISLVFAHPNDITLLYRLEHMTKIRFTEVKIPTGREICEHQVLSHVQKIKETPVNEEIGTFLPKIIDQFEGLTKEEVIERMAAFSFNNFLRKYLHAPDLNRGGKRKKRDFSADMHRLFINVGHLDLENKGQFLSLVCQYADIPGSVIGKIDMKRTHTYFDVEKTVVDKVKKRFSNSTLEGRSIRVNDGDSHKGKDRKHKKKHKKKHKAAGKKK